MASQQKMCFSSPQRGADDCERRETTSCDSTADQTLLAWLARQLMAHHQSEFYLEDFQPDWLRARQRSWYRWSVVLLVGLVFWLVGGLVGGLLYGLVGGLLYGLVGGLVGGLVFWLVFWLLFGLESAVEHAILRLWLWYSGNTPAPWHYVAFLDDAVEQLLLRRIGGGYIFRHRLLQDYFASLETNDTSDGNK